MSVDRRPSRGGAAVAAAAGLAAAGALAPVDAEGTALAAAGTALVVAGAVLASRRTRDLGLAWLVLAAVLAGLRGAGPGPLLVAGVAAVVAWDAADQAVGVGEQLGRAARTRRVEAVHAAGSLLVGLGGATVGYGAYRLAGGGTPVAALALLLVGAIALIVTLNA